MQTTLTSAPKSYESLGLTRTLIVIATIATAGWYMIWRLSTLNPDAPVFSWVLYGAEAFGIMTFMLHLLIVSRLTVREPSVPEAGHTVDVFIPTINESADIVRRTVIKAIDMAYPHQTWLLDDGNRPEMRLLAKELGCHYLARNTNEHAKAGNLNYALEHSSGEFIALFDADHAPNDNFLMRTLGYFKDSKVAFVQTPQDFYNLDSFQHRLSPHKNYVWTEQSLFFRIIQRGKDYWNASFFCGSCAIIRRSALASIGGFATGTVTEDIHTSIRLHKRGFQSVYHAESLAFGIAAPHVEPFMKQRIRWGKGAMQVWRREPIMFSSQLTVAQKLSYFNSMICTYFSGWQRLVLYCTSPIILLTGVSPILAPFNVFALHFIPYVVMILWCSSEINRGYSSALMSEQYNMINFAAFCRSTLSILRNKNIKFHVTNKKMTNETPQDLFLAPQYAVFALNAVAILFGLAIVLQGNAPYFLLTSIFWAGFNMCFAASALLFSHQRKQFNRRNYRFSIPLVLRLHTPNGQEYFASTDNISCAGLRILAPSELGLKSGDRISGELFLPDGPLHFSALARVSHNNSNTSAIWALGCEFVWNDSKERRRIEQFLYGSDLEWRIRNLTEKSPTFLEWMMDKTSETLSNENSQTSSMIMDNTSMNSKTVNTCIITVDPDTNRGKLTSFVPLQENDVIETALFTPEGWKRMRAIVANQNKAVDRTSSNVYSCQLEGIKV